MRSGIMLVWKWLSYSRLLQGKRRVDVKCEGKLTFALSILAKRISLVCASHTETFMEMLIVFACSRLAERTSWAPSRLSEVAVVSMLGEIL